MRVTHLHPSTYRRMPWKNGLGVTTEIARSPGDGDFDWRVSIAQVTADGPFSLFPGCDRIILALDGAGMILSHGDSQAAVTLGPLEPWTFSGDVETKCLLRDGPFRDFNVIARRTSFVPVVSVARPAAREILEGHAGTTILYCAAGAIFVEADGTFSVARDEALLIEHPAIGDERGVIQPAEPQTVIIHVSLSTAR